MTVRMTSAQYRALGNTNKLSKEDMKRIEKGLDPIEKEDPAQARVVLYLEELMHTYPGKILKFTAIPNSTWTPSKAQKAKNKRLGLRPGLCDLFIVYQGKTQPQSLWIEMKREDGGEQSKFQKEWVALLDRTKGSAAYFANGFQDAKYIIDAFIF